jgi:D-glycero-beta-D-manno-heptose-7-phosphate kinase
MPAAPSPSRIRTLIGQFDTRRILVVGDVMLDRFVVGSVTRISPEAPVPVVRFRREHERLGGGANVAHNIVALGGQAVLVGTIGDDAAGRRVRARLEDAAITADLVTDPARPTTEKVRVVTERNQQVARIDYEDDTDVGGEIERALAARIAFGGRDAHALLVSDYLKGVVTAGVMDALRALAAPARNRPLVVDPKIPHLACYAGASLVTPNHHEADTATHMRIRTDGEARAAALDFRRRANCAAVLVTRGEHGMYLSADGCETAIAAAAREVADVTGAGDTVAATLALALAAGASLEEAAILANHAAGIVVGKFGAATVSRAELMASLE